MRIRTLQGLKKARDEHRAVFCPISTGVLLTTPLPAAVVMNWTGEIILRMFEKGLYIYHKKGAKNAF